MDTTIENPSRLEPEAAGEPGRTENGGERTQEHSEHASSMAETAQNRTQRALESAKHSAKQSMRRRKGELARKIHTMGSSLEETAKAMRAEDLGATALARSTENAALRIHEVAEYLEENDLPAISEDARGLIRRHPAVSFGALFAAGLIAGRFLKATQPGASAEESVSPAEPETSPMHEDPYPQHVEVA